MALRSILKALPSLSTPSLAAGEAVLEKAVADAASPPVFEACRLAILDDFEQAGIAWLWATDATGGLIYISEKASEKLACPLEHLAGQPLANLFETDRGNVREKSDRSLPFLLGARRKICDLTVRFTQVRGSGIWLSISGNPKFAETGEFLGYRGSAKDITAEYNRKVEDSRLAEYDSLTGLANRHRMQRLLETTLAAYKSAERSCALVMLDLDRFKQVNDMFGHPAGDELLKQVGRRLGQIIGNTGEIGRLGGDEFQIIVPDLDDRGKLGELANKLIQTISQPYQIDGFRAVIGTSVGIAIAPFDGGDREALVRSADLALYAAKNGGRGQFRFYSSDLKDESEERRLLEADLREALANDELELHYQPVVRASDNMVVGYEALMRWEHPERGYISPDMFIPLAEESNLINQLGEWALHRACHAATQWPQSVQVAVNVSAVQFINAGLATIVAQALAASGLDPARLELELTESVFMGDSETIDDIFKTLKGLGVRLALDDFGTGYSSLSYLRSAPFDKIKIDRTFVEYCTQKDQNSAKIISAIIGLSEALGMETTVEGVEAFDQLHLVCGMGAKYIQGWIYSKALRQSEIDEHMASGAFKIEPDGPNRHRAERRSVFRRIGIVHEDHRYEAVMRELSKTGARVEGLLGVPEGAELVLDLGFGQLVICTVRRSKDATIAVEFDRPLVSDGAGGLCTRHRVSPYALAKAGMPVAGASGGAFPVALTGDGRTGKPQFMQVDVTKSRAGKGENKS